ncbi:MAG: XisI protein [Cyanobacteria bacterium P01_C01_bin.89]
MDRLEQYRGIIEGLLTHYDQLSRQSVESQAEDICVFDRQRDCYMWLQLGWQRGRRLCGPTILVRLLDGKVLLEADWTDFGVADDLIAAGIAEEDLVLAFQPPALRQSQEAVLEVAG